MPGANLILILTLSFLGTLTPPARGFTLAALIRTAYRVQEFQVIGGPDWINTDRFDVEGTFPESISRRLN